MKIHSVIEGTRVNGPGFRLGVWVQGCQRNCPGCFNTETCRMDGGRDVPVGELVRLALRQQYDGVSVSGGEPFYQDDELARLLEECRRYGMNTLVYTGYTYEELSTAGKHALRHCDYLIDGEYRRRPTITAAFSQSISALPSALTTEKPEIRSLSNSLSPTMQTKLIK